MNRNSIKILLALFLIAGLYAGCKKVDVPDGTPGFVKRKIREYMKKDVQNPPASVWRYDFKGEQVYYFPPSCCDQFSDLYNEKGDLLCHPDGGISGNGDGQCPDFWNTKSGGVEIWKDNRK